jgi:exonuclease SbcC
MKPVNLTLSNYRAIESADIDLSVIDAAAITGPNGAGKSTIVEGMLWSIFGESRSSRIDGLVRDGSDEASVQFDYLHNGQVYRVIRKRSRGKRSDLQYMVGDYDDWQPLTGATMAETQAKIVRDLAMDKDLFLASSFVLQGESAGICTAQPRERKELLMQLLEDRLGKFGPLHEAAKQTVKGVDEALVVARTKRDDLETRIAVKADVTEDRARLTSDLHNLKKQLTEAESERDKLRQAQATAKADMARLAELERQIADLSREMSGLLSQINEQQGIVDGAQRLISQAPIIREKCAEADRLEAELVALSTARDKYVELTQAYRDKESERDAAKAAIDLESAQAKRKLESETADLDKKLGFAEAALRNVEVHLENARRRSALLGEVPCNGTAMAGECKLLADARDAGLKSLDLETEAKEHQAAIDEVKPLIANLLERGESQIAEIDARWKKEFTVFSTTISHMQGQAIGYDKSQHETIQRQYDSDRQARELLLEITAAESRVDAARKSKNDLDKTLRGKKLQGMGLDQDRDALKAKVSAVDDPFGLDWDLVCGGFSKQIETTAGQIAVYDERLKQIAEAEAELLRVTAGLGELGHKRMIYVTLQDAFSRNGIPALVIDAAIPDIQDHANEVLSQLSDGKMSLKLVTQRQTSGGIAETLDIVVSVSTGERFYEEFSGGEKLRIDLSVRIALGRVLAQRTGTKIETLVLDECCSPLDEAGEDALIDCINKLRSVFGCILVISHRDTIKDRLPQRIEVSKNGHGTQIEVMA